jgi:hypothetical protein
VEQGGELAPDRIAPLAAAADQVAGCPMAVRRAAVTLHLAALDAAASDGALPPRRLAPTTAAITAALRCSPLDGNLWLRLAMVKAAENAPLAEVVRALEVSYWTAPSEGWVILARTKFVAPLRAAGVPLLATEFGDDLRNLVLYGATEDIVATRAELPAALAPKFDRLVARVPEPRHTAIENAVALARGVSPADLFHRRWANPNLTVFRPEPVDPDADPPNPKR